MSTAVESNADLCSATAVTRLIDAHTLTDSLVQPTNAAPYGVRTCQGQRATQEDAFSVQKLGSPVDSAPGSPTASPHHSDTESESGDPRGCVLSIPNDLEFFSVYDGHGGREVAEHCREKLHGHFVDALKQSCRALGSPTASPSPAASPAHEPAQLESVAEVDAITSLPDSCLDGDGRSTSTAAAALSPDTPVACDGAAGAAASPTSSGEADAGAADGPGQDAGVRLVSDALRTAFLRTDGQLAGSEVGEFVGATAVVAVLGSEHIWVAHCGDSRAVLSRGGEAEPITLDHKPDREDEAARVRAAGGKVVFTSGSYRVMGMLAMSRAIGDHFLRPYVIAEPEITVIERTAQDEVLVIATDGLWDVFSNAEATALASRCIMRSMERGMSRHGACRVAASVLTKAALERGSRDNVTVIVVDISLHADDQLQAEKLKSMIPSSARPDGRKLNKPNSFSVGTYYWIKSGTTSGDGSGSAAGSGGGGSSGSLQRQGSMPSQGSSGGSGQQDKGKGPSRTLSRAPANIALPQPAGTPAMDPALSPSPQPPLLQVQPLPRSVQVGRQVSPWLMASMGCSSPTAASAAAAQQQPACPSVLGTRQEHPCSMQAEQRPHKMSRVSASGRRMPSGSVCGVQAGAEVPAASNVPLSRVVETCSSSLRGVGWGGPHRLLMH